MTNEEAIGNLTHAIRWNDMPKKEALDMAIKALEQEPCEDAISRQGVLDEINRIGIKAFETYNDYSQFFDFVDTLPPVTPQPKIGHWIRVDKDKCKCDQCEVVSFIAMYPDGDINHCPNCGADMRGEVPITKRIECGTDGNLYEMSITNGKEYENTMREAIPEELESVNNYIKSISKPTGVNIWDEIEEVTTDADGSYGNI